jgi:hypothetical protein
MIHCNIFLLLRFDKVADNILLLFLRNFTVRIDDDDIVQLIEQILILNKT